MTDTPNNLTDRALQRLRKLAPGNGLEPAAISILEKQEQDFTFAGRMEVTPLSEVDSVAYPGPCRDKNAVQVSTKAALEQAVTEHKQKFRETPDWIAMVTDEIKTHDSQGWGLENAKVTLPEKSGLYALTEICPSCGGSKNLTCTQCMGQGTVICNQCQGRGRETCYMCGGRGENPHSPGQPCPTCQGTKMAVCRFCQGNRYLACPTCGGKRGTPCTSCQATGSLTQQATITCGAEAHFKLNADGLPSGLRRGLERIGIVNLGKGHATITPTPPTKEELENVAEKAPIPILNYRVTLPYAELRMAFGSKKAIVAVVGKRCAISGVPNFLDDTLAPWREKLSQAARGKTSLSEATEARAINEILSLTLAGKDRGEEVRKLYPFGLSANAIQQILRDMRLAVNRATVHVRSVVAVVCGMISAGFFYLFFDYGIEVIFSHGKPVLVGTILDLTALGTTLLASWALLNFSTRFVLQRRFPQAQHTLNQKIGKTGLTMLGGIILCFVAALALSPIRPLWLSLLLH